MTSKAFLKSKKFIWLIMWICLVVFLAIGISLTVVGAPDYYKWVDAYVSNAAVKPEGATITLFVYGLFFVVLSILDVASILLYSYGIFSKKAKQ